MPIESISTKAEEIGALSYRAGALTVTAALITGIALIAIVATGLYTSNMGLAFPRRILLYTLIPLTLTIPLFVKGALLQKTLNTKRPLLINEMKARLTPLQRMPSKLLTPYIENTLFDNWHRTYKQHLITQLKTEFPKGNVKKALEEVEKNLMKGLEKMGQRE